MTSHGWAFVSGYQSFDMTNKYGTVRCFTLLLLEGMVVTLQNVTLSFSTQNHVTFVLFHPTLRKFPDQEKFILLSRSCCSSFRLLFLDESLPLEHVVITTAYLLLLRRQGVMHVCEVQFLLLCDSSNTEKK